MKYTIGIDLGTTNCTMAYSTGTPEIHQFEIPQITSADTQGDDLSLPSFIYFPLKEEQIKGTFCIGIHARQRGGEIPDRLIASAKSWLCHTGIDRRQDRILPATDDPEVQKMSPLEACAELLRAIKEAWNSKMPHAPFDQQQILVTVPASFDPSARQLTLEASLLAGYPEVILLEEPQAAFYAWLHRHDEWRKQLKVDDHVLVVDIGGGTTDFSLISVADDKGNLSLKRLAVGSHLLLGGDNFDLALAYLAKQKFEDQGREIDDWQMQSLIHQCREAKEKLMGENPPESVEVTILGRGSRLIGGTLKTEISRQEASKCLVDGFIPLIGPEEQSPMERRMGIQQLGLPYAQDPRISAQLAKFLSMTGEDESASIEKFSMPSAVLFNGGTLKGAAFRNRMIDLLNSWAKQLKKKPVIELQGPDYDFGVSRGAVYYGLSREGRGIRIKSGTSRSYWIGVEDAVPAIPGVQQPLKAFCIVPHGMEEGTELTLNEKEFALLLGEKATFRFFSHATPLLSNGVEPKMGTSLKNWKQELSELNAIEARLDRKEGDGKTVKVRIKSKITELGMLEVWCESHDNRKWKLEFDIRNDKRQRP